MNRIKISRKQQMIIDIVAPPLLLLGFVYVGGTAWELKSEIDRLNKAQTVLPSARGCQAISRYAQLQVFPEDSIHQFQDGGCGIKGFKFWFGNRHRNLYSLEKKDMEGKLFLKKEDIISFLK